MNASPNIPDRHRNGSIESEEPLKPLLGKTIMVTRAADDSGRMISSLEDLGANIIVHPVIKILPLDNASNNDDIISRIDSFDWIVFFSTIGVRCFFDRLHQIHGKVLPWEGQGGGLPWTGKRKGKRGTPSLDHVRFAAIGPATAAQVTRLGRCKTDLVPEVANSTSLAQSLVPLASGGHRVLLVRASRGSRELALQLQQSAIDFEEIVVYRSVDVALPDPHVASQLRLGQIDWVTMTSSATARSTIRLFGSDLRFAKTVSIGPTTSSTMNVAGLVPDAESAQCSMQGVIDAILRETGPR